MEWSAAARFTARTADRETASGSHLSQGLTIDGSAQGVLLILDAADCGR